MFFLNLSLPEFLALLGSLSGVVVALYLLDRARKKHIVATLRFFTAAENPPVLKHRRKLQQPWSLLLQVISLLLLLLAIAQLRFGSPAQSSRDHVLILDTSAWMAARSGQGRLIDQARAAARGYLRALPMNDRLMIVRADALATPAILFESDRRKLQQAIDQSQPSAAPLNLQQAFDFAQQAQRLHSQRPGEIAFIGAARTSSDDAQQLNPPANLRYIPIAGPSEHSGLRKVSVRRSTADPDIWEVFIAAKNYGARARTLPLAVQFGGAPVGTHRFDLKPGAEDSTTLRFKTRAAGWLEARLLTPDPFGQDDRAILELPARTVVPVMVYSSEPDLLRPVFNAIPGVQAAFMPASSYDSNVRSGIVLLDRFAPPSPPSADSIWIEPPAAKSPIPVQSTQQKIHLSRWQPDHPLGAGLRVKDLEFPNAQILRADPGDITIAASDSGPLIVARPGKPKTVVLGFHPVRAGMKYELATPLLFANIVRWMAPDVFRSWELNASTVGTVDVAMDTEPDPNTIRVQTEDGARLPFTVEGRNLHFFSGAPGIVRVLTGDRELVYSLTLPQPGDVVWRPSRAKFGLPGQSPAEPAARDIWQWLALLGAAGLLADWILYGRMQRRVTMPERPAQSTSWRKAS
jgi:von Willebrand factor type A domain